MGNQYSHKQKRLTNVQKYQLTKMVEADHKSFSGATLEDVAVALSAKLGFLVTPNQVSIVKETLQVDWASPSRDSYRTKELYALIVSLTERVVALEKIIERFGSTTPVSGAPT